MDLLIKFAKVVFMSLYIFLQINHIALAETRQPTSYMIAHDLRAIQPLLKELPQKTLIVFDIDDVLIRPSDSAFYPINKNLLHTLDQELSSRKNLKQMQELWSIVFQNRNHEVFDPYVDKIFTFLKDKQVPTIALTHCGTGPLGILNSVEDWRIKTLKKLNIDFSHITPIKNQYIFNTKGKFGQAMLKKGILFTGGVDKGRILVEFLSAYNLDYKKIIFIDNQKKNLASVDSALKSLSLEYLGVHYIPRYLHKVSPLTESEIRSQFQILEKQKQWKGDQEFLRSNS